MRIRRLGYFDDVNIETPPVPGTPDQVDVEVTVTEKPTGNLLAGVGYSSADGLVFNASVSQQNIFGTGNALIAAINTSTINRTISLAFTEPYWTVDGISRTLEVYHRNIDPTSLSVSQYASSTLGARGRLRRPDHRDRHDQPRLPLRAHRPDAVRRTARRSTIDSSHEFGDATNSFILSAGWSRDTRDDILYPTRGPLQSALASRSGCRSATSRTTR